MEEDGSEWSPAAQTDIPGEIGKEETNDKLKIKKINENPLQSRMYTAIKKNISFN